MYSFHHLVSYTLWDCHIASILSIGNWIFQRISFACRPCSTSTFHARCRFYGSSGVRVSWRMIIDFSSILMVAKNGRLIYRTRANYSIIQRAVWRLRRQRNALFKASFGFTTMPMNDVFGVICDAMALRSGKKAAASLANHFKCITAWVVQCNGNRVRRSIDALNWIQLVLSMQRNCYFVTQDCQTQTHFNCINSMICMVSITTTHN